MKCKCKHKSHRGLCLRLSNKKKTFDNRKDLCYWCADDIHEDQQRTPVKADGEW